MIFILVFLLPSVVCGRQWESWLVGRGRDMKRKFFPSLRWPCFLLAWGMFTESSPAESHTPGLDAEQQGGAGLGGACLSSPPSPTHLEGLQGSFPPALQGWALLG